MIRCPKCQSDSRVIDSREQDNSITRVRRCVKCLTRWKTWETANLPSTVAVRKMQRLLVDLTEQVRLLQPATMYKDLGNVGNKDHAHADLGTAQVEPR
jgi:transcriptional regulator NrdR family protein